jgi:hypothetical protein
MVCWVVKLNGMLERLVCKSHFRSLVDGSFVLNVVYFEGAHEALKTMRGRYLS